MPISKLRKAAWIRTWSHNLKRKSIPSDTCTVNLRTPKLWILVTAGCKSAVREACLPNSFSTSQPQLKSLLLHFTIYFLNCNLTLCFNNRSPHDFLIWLLQNCSNLGFAAAEGVKIISIAVCIHKSKIKPWGTKGQKIMART